MFKLFKRKNKIKELETRILTLECDITKLIGQFGVYRVYNSPDAYTKGEYTLEKLECSCKNCNKEDDYDQTFKIKEDGSICFKGGIIKDATISGATVSCGNCNKEDVIPLENTEFIDKLAKKVSNIIEKNKESQNDEVILNIDGIEVAKIAKEEFKGLNNYKIIEK